MIVDLTIFLFVDLLINVFHISLAIDLNNTQCSTQRSRNIIIFLLINELAERNDVVFIFVDIRNATFSF